MFERSSASEDTKLLFEKETYAIRGAVFEVYREMGCGFLEAVYQECLEKEFNKRKISYASQQELAINYKGESLKQIYKPDFVCFDSIIVELKVVSAIKGEHQAQALNYLKATGLKVALLVNFGSHPKATIERIVY